MGKNYYDAAPNGAIRHAKFLKRTKKRKKSFERFQRDFILRQSSHGSNCCFSHSSDGFYSHTRAIKVSQCSS